MSTVDPKALAVFADAARQLGAELRDEDAEEALRYVVHLWAVRCLMRARPLERGWASTSSWNTTGSTRR